MIWPHVEIRQIAEVVSGVGFPIKYQGVTDEEYPFYKVGDMNTAGNETCMTVAGHTISEDILRKLKARAFPKGTIVFPKIGAAIATNKKRMLTRPSVVDNNVMGFIPSKHIDEWFLFYWMQQFDLRTVANIGPVPSMRKSEVERVAIPYPPRTEQRRIVEILDQADALRQQRRAADDKASRILPALFHKHIGDPGLNPKNWPLVELSKFGSPLSGGGFPLDEQGHAEGEYPFIKVSDMNSPGNEVYIRSANHWVSGETLQRLRVKAAPAGTTIFPKIGAAVATNKKRLLVQDTAYDNNVIGVVPHKPEWANYIFAFFLLFDLRRLTRTTALPSIKTSELAALPIPKPSDDVIGAFDSQFRQLLSYQEAQRRSAEQINRLFEVLLHRAFSGDLTAKWREANKAQLEAELEQQMAALGEADADSPRRGRKRKAVN